MNLLIRAVIAASATATLALAEGSAAARDGYPIHETGISVRSRRDVRRR